MEKNVQDYYAFKRGEIKIPEHLAVRRELTGPLFQNKFLERLTRTGIYTPIILHLSIGAGVFWYGTVKLGIPLHHALIALVSGFVFWTFAEYCVHRFLYHTETSSRALFRIQYNAHGIHHQYPIDPTRLAMPPVPGLLLAGMFFLLFWLIGGHYAFVFYPGFILGYLVYISFHYAQHRIKSPIYPPFKALWKHHQMHHYVDPYSAYGVSTRLWDFVFGTMPKEKKPRRR